ncbi:jg3972 [Pararge aegeria aegeria]|uniref:Serine/threonine-protein phosphatase n=1 Tax=Pararge aegeria aegeria TaxID=348720 RepID=A0A8S4RXA9_9NEOP|nr:jg3972 [Pararge aegeria aegeria]
MKKFGNIKDMKKFQGMRNRLQWFSTVELERQRAHAGLRSPELIVFAQMAVGDTSKDESVRDSWRLRGLSLNQIRNEGKSTIATNLRCALGMATGVLVEICEDSVLVGSEAAGGASSLASPHCQLLQAAGYCRDDQMRLYREFMLMVYPALYMSSTVFSQFMIDHGWERSQCSHLFRSYHRAADISGRGGLSFLEVLLWAAALEPNTQHAGVAAEMRCRYIFRYFDSNRDLKLEFGELKELMAAARSARQLPVDALSVARDADLVLRQLGLGSNSSLSISDFLRSVDEQHVRGTVEVKDNKSVDTLERAGSDYARARGTAGEYALATCVVRLDPRFPPEMMHLSTFDEDAVSISTARLLSDSNSLEQFDVRSASSEAFAAIHHFATAIDNTPNKRSSGGSTGGQSKEAYSWVSAGEGAALGALLLRLAEAVRPLCMNEPRLLRLTSPVYAIGDLHGNLAALLAMAAALWPSGPALVPATLLFLGDYVDRGPHGAELMAYLFAAKLQRPDSVYLIRGNHETRDIQKMFTFHTECIAKYGEVEGAHIWNAINQVFDVLALAAVVDDKVMYSPEDKKITVIASMLMLKKSNC